MTKHPDSTSSPTHVLVILNPKAGHYSSQVMELLERSFDPKHWSYEIFETTDFKQDTIKKVRQAPEDGIELIVVAGGDGTISSVADGLSSAKIPLGIIPVGTGNILARELGIPLGLKAACELLVSDHCLTQVDLMQVGERMCVSHLSIGVYSLIARETDLMDKRRFGRTAYLWAALMRLLGYQSWRFTLTIDGQRSRRFRASLIMVANAGTVGIPPFRWGTDIRPNDGQLDVCIIRAKTLIDYLGIIWHALLNRHEQDHNVSYLTAERNVTIETNHSLPVRADGEIIGERSVQVRVHPDAMQIIVPVSNS